MKMKNNGFLIKIVNMSKSYGSIQALRNISIEIGYNEVIGLVGDNGAGKSTLIKTMTGVQQPDSGEMYWKGQKLVNLDVSRARRLGISTVFQDKALSPQHSIWRNIFLGRELTNRFGFIKIKKQKEETLKLMKGKMSFTSAAIGTDTIVGFMSGGEQQGVAISRALYFDSELIILDEPTTGLSLTESQKVLNFIRSIKKEGRSAIFISHNLFHVYPVIDKIVIIDRGKIVGNYSKGSISLSELEKKMQLIASDANAQI